MRKHLIQLQRKNKNIKCGQCNKIFITCRNLDNPQKMHNERRAHECNIRDKTVKRKRGVKIAPKEIYVGGKLFGSNYCDKSF